MWLVLRSPWRYSSIHTYTMGHVVRMPSSIVRPTMCPPHGPRLMASWFAHLHQSCSLGKKNREVEVVGLSPHIPLEVHVSKQRCCRRRRAVPPGMNDYDDFSTAFAAALALSSCLLFLVSRPRRSHWSSSNVRSSSNWGGLSQRIFWKFPAEGSFIPQSAFEAERHTSKGKPFHSDSDLIITLSTFGLFFSCTTSFQNKIV